MKLRLTTNIGTIDNKRFGLENTLEGEVNTVTHEKTADELIRRGLAVPANAAAEKAVEKLVEGDATSAQRDPASKTETFHRVDEDPKTKKGHVGK